MAKTKAKLYVMEGCPACGDAKKEISRRKKAGTLCMDYQLIDIDKYPRKCPDAVKFVPMVEIDGKLMSFKQSLQVCVR
ncbi:MAG: hypothetical protein Q8O68_00565 [Candidatus Daviesbacteria bacterium]|nr:hypothetical protein [Candidatus Daviesbacteria bacterium]